MAQLSAVLTAGWYWGGIVCMGIFNVFFLKKKLIVGPQGIAGAEISADDICGCKSAEFLSLECPGGRRKRQLQGSHLHSGL